MAKQAIAPERLTSRAREREGQSKSCGSKEITPAKSPYPYPPPLPYPPTPIFPHFERNPFSVRTQGTQTKTAPSTTQIPPISSQNTSSCCHFLSSCSCQFLWGSLARRRPKKARVQSLQTAMGAISHILGSGFHSAYQKQALRPTDPNPSMTTRSATVHVRATRDEPLRTSQGFSAKRDVNGALGSFSLCFINFMNFVRLKEASLELPPSPPLPKPKPPRPPSPAPSPPAKPLWPQAMPTAQAGAASWVPSGHRRRTRMASAVGARWRAPLARAVGARRSTRFQGEGKWGGGRPQGETRCGGAPQLTFRKFYIEKSHEIFRERARPSLNSFLAWEWCCFKFKKRAGSQCFVGVGNQKACHCRNLLKSRLDDQGLPTSSHCWNLGNKLKAGH